MQFCISNQINYFKVACCLENSVDSDQLADENSVDPDQLASEEAS